MTGSKKISELGQNTVRLITATQIATSVPDIIKELVENALDAGSTIIRVKLENSGLDKIEVCDNGSGITKDDLEVCSLPHFTSKIRDHDDLKTLKTYGFRGEALSAVCSISKVIITSKTKDDLVATTCQYDHQGRITDKKPSANGQGTLVAIAQLFHNVPVRKQFFSTPKRKKDELTKVEDLLLSFGLIHPQLHLNFHHNHGLVWQKSRAPDFRANVFQVLGLSVSSHMEFIESNNEIQALIITPKRTAPEDTCFRSKPDRCFTYVNDRPVCLKEIDKLMKALYEPVTGKSSLYPIFIVTLQLPGDEVEVDLEPNKSRVLLTCQSEVLELVRNLVESVVKSDVALGTGEKTGLVSDTEVVEQTTTPDPFADEDEDMFNGFCEPFDEPAAPAIDDTAASTPVFTVGSDEWSRGVARDSDGRIVHPVELLRGGDHFAKRITEEPQLKRPRLMESEEALKIIGYPAQNLEMVNGKVRRLPSDPYENYCREMSREFLSQNPTTTFNELTQQLNESWRNLSSDDRQRYEKRTTGQVQKQRAAPPKSFSPRLPGGGSLDRFLCPQTPVIRARVSQPAVVNERPIVDVEFSLKTLNSKRFAAPVKPHHTWVCVGQVADRSGWICSREDQLYAVNFQRLYEVVLFSRMLSQHHLPTKKALNPLTISHKSFSNPMLWDVLVGLSAEWESPCTRVVDDSRITANGLGIRLRSGSTTAAEVFLIPAGATHFNLHEVQQVLQLISKPDSSTENCRTEYVKDLIKLEANQLAAERHTSPDPKELNDLLSQWNLDGASYCLHGHPLMKSLDISLKGGAL